MPERCSYDYAVIRVVPRVDRGEFINAGVIVSCPSRGFLQALVMLDRPRLAAFAPTLDLEVIGSHLEAIPRICHGGEEAGPIGKLPQRARFHWLTVPRSTVIQISPAHTQVSVKIRHWRSSGFCGCWSCLRSRRTRHIVRQSRMRCSKEHIQRSKYGQFLSRPPSSSSEKRV